MLVEIRLSDIASVEQMPTSILTDWCVAKVGTDYYFTGTAADSGKMRRSTAIVNLDKERGCGQTQSGRIYELVGPALNPEHRHAACALLFGGTDATEELGISKLMSAKAN